MHAAGPHTVSERGPVVVRVSPTLLSSTDRRSARTTARARDAPPPRRRGPRRPGGTIGAGRIAHLGSLPGARVAGQVRRRWRSLLQARICLVARPDARTEDVVPQVGDWMDNVPSRMSFDDPNSSASCGPGPYGTWVTASLEPWRSKTGASSPTPTTFRCCTPTTPSACPGPRGRRARLRPAHHPAHGTGMEARRLQALAEVRPADPAARRAPPNREDRQGTLTRKRRR